MKTNILLFIVWLAVGIFFSYDAIGDLSTWRADPMLIRMGFDWTQSRLPEGVVAILCSGGLIVGRRPGLWLSFAASFLFGLYFFAYLVFGGEGALFVRVVVPFTLLCLSIGTITYIRRKLHDIRSGQVKISTLQQ